MQKNCLACGNIFHRPIGKKRISRKVWNNRKFCSNKCNLIINTVRNNPNTDKPFLGHTQIAWNRGLLGRQKWHNTDSLGLGRIKGIKKPALQGSNNSKWNSVEKECIICQKKYFVQNYRKNKSRFCSHICYHKWHIGENSPVWTDNYKKSFRNRIMQLREYKDWRFQCMRRDDFKCKWCNSIHKKNVHHVKSFSLIMKESNITTVEGARKCKELWNMENGITLCEECHRKTDNYLKNI